jgi:hypothetical protein
MHQYFLHNLSIHVSQNKTALHVLCIHEQHILQSNLTTAARYGGVFTDDMIKGLSAGFGFFVALIVLICLIWYCCCAENNNTVRTIDIKSENTRVSNRDWR